MKQICLFILFTLSCTMGNARVVLPPEKNNPPVKQEENSNREENNQDSDREEENNNGEESDNQEEDNEESDNEKNNNENGNPPEEENKSVLHGPVRIVNQTLETLSIEGPAEIENAHIVQATIKGPVNAYLSTFDRLEIEGIARFDHSRVGELLLNGGPLLVRDSSFQKILTSSPELVLSNARITMLWVKRSAYGPYRQRVYLERDTQIDTIVFESHNGRVIFGDRSVVVDRIEGGQIEPPYSSYSNYPYSSPNYP